MKREDEMTLELKQSQADCLKKLLRSNKGNHSPSRRTNAIKITPEEVVEVKQLFSEGNPIIAIMAQTGLSRWIVTGTKDGRYDHLIGDTNR